MSLEPFKSKDLVVEGIWSAAASRGRPCPKGWPLVPDASTEPGLQAARDADRTSCNLDDASATADVAATDRDDAAADREVASEERDRAAAARDLAAEDREYAEGPGGPEYTRALLLAAEVRAQAAADRELAAADRGRALRDRQEAGADRARAASDRQHAARDRDHAAMDRRDARAELKRAYTDDLTGAYRRGSGEVALRHELNRARRTGQSLVMVYVDVDHLKETNDRVGHAAGDVRLRDVVNAMRSKLRSYEPIVRYGGDEFVCSVADVELLAVQARFAEIDAVLSERDHPGAISIGLAQMQPDDTLETLIDRADRALVQARAGDGATGHRS
jgi:diguanylate cyclase (GGDEF)-like protein